MDKKKVMIPILFCALFSIVLYGQNKDSLFVHLNLEIKHAKKIPFNSFKVEFNSFKKGKVKVEIQSKPLIEKLKKWEYSVIDTTFYIDRKTYKQINDSILKIESKTIAKNLRGQFFPSIGGYKCKLEFGAFSNKISYSIENPSPYEEHSMMFYNTCYIILEKIGFDPNEIMENPESPEDRQKVIEKFNLLKKSG